uniref:Mlo2 n=1 Tax=Arundo donax TaxID=35708 RepID=A0A0A9DQZ1_ARUDO
MMAIELTERHTVIQGMTVVKLSDDHFWFGEPLLLHLIHFASFQVSKGPERYLINKHANLRRKAFRQTCATHTQP